MGGFLAFFQAHPVECLVVASAVLNAALSLRSPERLVAWAERSPRGAALVALVRALGVDPAAAIRAGQALLAARAAAAAAEGAQLGAGDGAGAGGAPGGGGE